ncbi:MAG: hypothetical protein AABX84_03430 [Nanoarchaeota archaeon]
MFNLFKRRAETKPSEVYCQNCGNELTNNGGDVASNGAIYCHGYKRSNPIRCIEEAMFRKNILTPLIGNYLNAQEVQVEIERKELTNFSPLEKVVS